MPEEIEKKERFIMVTGDYSGFGYAKMITDAGYACLVAYKFEEKPEGDQKQAYKDLGTGFFQKAPLEKVIERRDDYRDAYWFVDHNKNNAIAQMLHDEGFKVWGGLELSGRMEHDRQFGIDLAHKAGLDTPPEFEFQTVQDGIAHLLENPECAYVFKPNDPDDKPGAVWNTYLPDSDEDESANQELLCYLQSLGSGLPGGFILQERKHGVEANFELWVNKGEPLFAFCDLECKKKLSGDLGPLVGGAQDIGFAVDLDCRGIQETCAKVLALPEFKDYTGYIDVNVIISEKEHYFLEFCGRFGYPAHTTLFAALARSPFPVILMDMIDGNKDGFYHHFKHGFAAGITLYTDKNRRLMPIYVSEKVDSLFFPYDSCIKDGLPMLAGASTDIEVGVITGHGYTMKIAAEEALRNMEKVHFPNRSARNDLDKNCYPSAPQGRYDALVAMKYI